jgi:hypothetical protein
MPNLSLALLLIFFVHGSVLSQGEPLVKRLEGAWQGQGKAFGRPANVQIKFEWVLGNKFLRLSLKNEMTGASGQVQVFEGHAYYRPQAEGKFDAKWFDSRGESFPINAHTENDALIALWGLPEREQGKSVYRIVEPGKLEVVDSVLQKDGTFREFGRVILTRQ